MEEHLWHLRLLTHCCSRRWQDLLRPWRTQSPTQKHKGPECLQKASVTTKVYRCEWYALGWPLASTLRMELEHRQRSELLLRYEGDKFFPEKVRFRPDLQITPSDLVGLWVFQLEDINHHFQCTKLLWWFLEPRSCLKSRLQHEVQRSAVLKHRLHKHRQKAQKIPDSHSQWQKGRIVPKKIKYYPSAKWKAKLRSK